MIISKQGDSSVPKGVAVAAALPRDNETKNVDLACEPAIAQALRLLRHAGHLADDCARPRVEFAVSLGELRWAGVSAADLRWLLEKRLVVHWWLPAPDAETRKLVEAPNDAMLSERSCLCLTDAGVRVAESLEGRARGVPHNDGNNSELASNDFLIRGPHFLRESGEAFAGPPSWDSERHELWCGSVLIKRFKWRASNQERILAAFEEEGWPARIDDPLPPRAEIDSKRRLGDTIKCLNRNHLAAILKFVGDGSGQGVIWEFQAERPRKSK